MNLNQTEQRRTFIKLAVGFSSVTWATWGSAHSEASSVSGLSLENQLLRLPSKSEPMVVSGRVLSAHNKPCCGKSLMLSAQQIVTDADGRFWHQTNTTELQNAFMASNNPIVNHQLTQDPHGVWRLYLELSA